MVTGAGQKRSGMESGRATAHNEDVSLNARHAGCFRERIVVPVKVYRPPRTIPLVGLCWQWRWTARRRETSFRRPATRSRSELTVGGFSSAEERDPERQGDQAQIEPERLAPDVQVVEAKLLPSWNVAPSVDLSNPGEARGHLAAPLEPRHGLKRNRHARRVDLDALEDEVRAGRQSSCPPRRCSRAAAARPWRSPA